MVRILVNFQTKDYSVFTGLNANSIVRTVAKKIIVRKTAREILKRQFLRNKTIRSLGDKLLGDKTQKIDLCVCK